MRFTPLQSYFSLFALCLMIGFTGQAQVLITAEDTPVTIDFDGYAGGGFATSPAAG